ncbi:MAG TPA: DUF4157 domain-containing protein [Kofleriaceae bacterium]|nr:DUF4157 domain-containing protein [Kofleriaceae bacterium]
MSFERAHAYARSGAASDDEPDDLAPGRLNRTAQLWSPEHPVRSGLIQRKASGAAMADDAADAVGRASTSAGRPLPDAMRNKFEASLGADLSAVRIHTGGDSHAAARAIGAKAYTLGQDIHFSGKHDPTSAADELLVAHEVAHTVQQQGSAPVAQHKLEVSAPTDGFEHEADRAADAMVAGAAFALGTAPVVAARKAGDDAGPGDIKPMNDVGYTSGPTQVHGAPDPKSPVLTTLPAGGWIKITGGNGSFYVVSYDGTKQGYVDFYDLDVDGQPSAVDVDPAQDAQTAQPAQASHTPADGADGAPNASQPTAGQRYRSAIQKALDFWAGAVEGGADGKFAKFRSSDSLEKARKEAGRNHKVYTTCIDFVGQVQSDAERDAHVKQTIVIDNNVSVPEGRKKLPKDAWHPGSRNMTDRPKAGDIVFYTFAADVKDDDGNLKFGKGWFSHTGYFNGLEKVAAANSNAPAGGDAKAGDAAPAAPAADPVELWHTVDGGQGKATKYDDKGNVTQTGAEELKQSDRYYHPAQNLISGEKTQGGDVRTVLGWVDVEKIVASDLPPDP